MASDWELREIVEVIWEDAQTFGGWHNRETYETMGTTLARSVGYLLKKSAKGVILLQTQSFIDGRMTDSITIPTRMVRKIRRLK